MRLWTIWTLPAMSFGERLRRTLDWAALKTAAKMPKRIRHWALVICVNEVFQSPAFSRREMGSITVNELFDKQGMM